MMSAGLEVTSCVVDREVATLRVAAGGPREIRRTYRILAEDLTGDVSVTWTAPEPVMVGTLVTVYVQPRKAPDQ